MAWKRSTVRLRYAPPFSVVLMRSTVFPPLTIRRGLFLLPLAILLLASCAYELSSSGIPRAKVYGGRLELAWVSVSPDGRLVEFSYKDRSKKTAGGMGVLDWRNGTLKRIEYKDSNGWWHSTQPGTGKRIVSVSGRPGEHLALADKAGNPQTVVLKPQDGFQTIFWPAFIGPNEVMFGAMGPVDPTLKQQVEALGADEHTSFVYTLKFGGKPRLLPTTTKYARELHAKLGGESYQFPSITHVVASRGGNRIAFIGQSLIEPKNAQAKYNYEIFVLENGVLRERTNLKMHMAHIDISADGSTIAFGADPTRTQSFDLWILDLNTNTTHQMSLAERFEQLPEFNQ